MLHLLDIKLLKAGQPIEAISDNKLTTVFWKYFQLLLKQYTSKIYVQHVSINETLHLHHLPWWHRGTCSGLDCGSGDSRFDFSHTLTACGPSDDKEITEIPRSIFFILSVWCWFSYGMLINSNNVWKWGIINICKTFARIWQITFLL